jgi:hypothetical protein
MTTRLMSRTFDHDRADSEPDSARRQHWECRITWAEVVGIETERMDATREPEDFPFLADSSRRRRAVFRRCPAPLIVLAAALAFGLGSHPMSSRADALKTIPTFTAYDPSSMSSSDISQWKTDPSIQIKYDGIVSGPSGSATTNPPTQWLEYTLTTTQAIAPAGASPPANAASNLPTPQVLALDTPISIIPPSSSSSSSLQVVSDSTGYYFDNTKQLLVSIGNTSLQNGSTPVQVQALGLSFYGLNRGLPAGGSLTFELPFNANIVGNPSAASSNSSTSTSSSSSSSSSSTTVSAQVGVGQGGGSGGTEVPEPFSLLVWSGLAGAGIWRARARARGRRSGPRP